MIFGGTPPNTYIDLMFSHPITVLKKIPDDFAKVDIIGSYGPYKFTYNWEVIN